MSSQDAECLHFAINYPDAGKTLIGTARNIARSYAKGVLTLGLIVWLIALVAWFYRVMPSLSLSLFVVGWLPVIIGIVFLRMAAQRRELSE